MRRIKLISHEESHSDLNKSVGKTIHKVTLENNALNVVIQFTDGTMLALSANMSNGDPFISATELEPEPLS